jgi:ParB/Sulfiredoxin domain
MGTKDLLHAIRAYDTGYIAADAERDYRRMRRHRRWAQLVRRLRHTCEAATRLVAFAEATAALGSTTQRDLGLQAVDLDTVVGSVGRLQDFDNRFRPGRAINARRWEALDRAMRSGEAIPPIIVYRVAGLHYVQDGHHRVSAAKAVGWESVDAYVTEVLVPETASRAA